jgi:hypothetical protein
MAGKSVVEDFRLLAEKAYNETFIEFDRIARLAGVKLKPEILGQTFVARKSPPTHRDSIEVQGLLRIENLPYQRKLNAGAQPTADRHSNGIFVLMDSLDIYKFDGKPSLENSFLYKSNVRVGYYRATKSKWSPLLCVRYDSESAHQAHPLFHAQLETGIHTDRLRSIFSNLPEIDKPLIIHEAVRVPTANVIGATVLVSLAADHLPLANFPDMLRAIRKRPFFKSKWRFNSQSLDDKESVCDVLSSGWYSSQNE